MPLQRPSGQAPASAVPASSESVRLEEPEVIGERNLRRPPPLHGPTPPTAAPSASAPRPAARPEQRRPRLLRPVGRRHCRRGAWSCDRRRPALGCEWTGACAAARRWCCATCRCASCGVTVEREGFKADERRVALSAAQPTVTVDARLVSRHAAGAGGDNRRAGDRIASARRLGLCRRPAGREPRRCRCPTSSPGTHRIRLEMAGFSPWVTTASIQAGVRTRVAASLERGTQE